MTPVEQVVYRDECGLSQRQPAAGTLAVFAYERLNRIAYRWDCCDIGSPELYAAAAAYSCQ